MSTLLTDRPAGTTTPTDRAAASGAVVRELARVLVRRMLRSPLLYAGAALSFGLAFMESQDRLWPLHAASRKLPWWLLPLAAAIALVAWVAATRDERSGIEEVVRPALAGPHERTVAQLVATAVVGVGAALATSTVVLGYLAGIGSGSSPDWLFVTQGIVVVLLGGVAGLAVGRWWPNRFGAVALLLLGGTYEMLTMSRSRIMFQAFSVTAPGEDIRLPELSLFPAGAHVLLLVGLLGLLATVVVLRHRRSLPTAIALVATSIVGVAAYTAMQQPPSEEAVEARIAWAEHGDEHRVCHGAGTVRSCTYPAYTALGEDWREAGQAVVSALPAGREAAPIRIVQDTRPWEVVQQLTRWLHPVEDPRMQRLNDRVTVREASAEPGVILVSVYDAVARGRWAAERDTSIAARIVGHALALPGTATMTYALTEDDLAWRDRILAEAGGREAFVGDAEGPVVEDGFGLPQLLDREVGDEVEIGVRCRLHGQAREAIGFWLVAQHPVIAADLAYELDQRPHDDRHPVPNMEGAHHQGASSPIWTERGRRAGLAMLDVPAAEVRAVLEADLERWLDGRTPVEELLTELDLDAEDALAPPVAAGGLAEEHQAEWHDQPLTADNATWVGTPCLGDRDDPQPQGAIDSYIDRSEG